MNESIVAWVGGNKTPSLLFACLFSIIHLGISFLIVMHPDMHLLHLHVTAVIAPPSPLPPVLVGSPSCKASRPIAQRGGLVLSGRIQCCSVHGSRRIPILSMVSRLLCSLSTKAFHASRTCSYLHCIYSSHMILVSLFRVFD